MVRTSIHWGGWIYVDYVRSVHYRYHYSAVIGSDICVYGVWHGSNTFALDGVKAEAFTFALQNQLEQVCTTGRYKLIRHRLRWSLRLWSQTTTRTRTETTKEEGCTRVVCPLLEGARKGILGLCSDNIHPRRTGRAAYLLTHVRALHSRGIMVVAAAAVVWTMPEMVVRGRRQINIILWRKEVSQPSLFVRHFILSTYRLLVHKLFYSC